MKRLNLLTFELFALMVLPAAAQITLEPGFLFDLRGTTYQSTIYTMGSQHFPAMDAIAAQTGGDQTYDFTPYTFSLASQVFLPVLASADGTPGENDPDLGGSNWVQHLDYGDGSGFWSYYDLSEDGYDYLGSIFRSGPGEQINKNVPADRIYAFPITAGTMWDQSIVQTTTGFGSTLTLNITEHNEVDGWGTLITPMGTAPCIRFRKTRVDEVAGKTTATIDTYFFLTNTNISASISYNSLVGGVSVVTYSLAGGAGTAVEEVPTHELNLMQNFPNPFSETTTIAFDLHAPAHADLRVFDLMGREVASLVDGMLPSGSHRAELSAEDLSGGMYVYRLAVDGVPTTRTLTLVKQ